MATLLKIKKYIARDNVVTKAIRMAENYLKTNTDEYGEISNPEVFYAAVDVLAPFSDDLKAANKIADYKNRALKLENKIEQAENSKTVFDLKLQEAVLKGVQDNLSDSRGMIFKMTDIYSTALDDFDENVLSKVLSSLPKGQPIPQEILNYRDKVSKKTRTLINLANSYLSTDPETNLAGPTNTEAYGFLLRTNPQTGAIVNLDIQEITSLDKASGYVRTNARYGRIPIYLNTYYSETKELGRLGDVVFERNKVELETGGTLKVLEGQWGEEAGGVGGWAWLTRLFESIGKETQKGLKQKQQEFPLGMTPFDYFAIPSESVVKDGKGIYYYYDKEMNLWRAENASFLKEYLRGIGRNPEDVDNKFYFGHSDFIKQMSKSEDGKERIINEDFFKVSGLKVSAVGGAVPRGVSPYSATTIPFGRFGRLPTARTPGEVAPSREWTPEGYQTKKVIEKGEKIFRGGGGGGGG